MKDSERLDALYAIESILSLLHHRGLVDTEENRADVRTALSHVRELLAEEARTQNKSVLTIAQEQARIYQDTLDLMKNELRL